MVGGRQVSSKARTLAVGSKRSARLALVRSMAGTAQYFSPKQMDGVAVAPAAASHRMLHNMTCLGYIHRAPSRLVFREQFCWRARIRLFVI